MGYVQKEEQQVKLGEMFSFHVRKGSSAKHAAKLK